MVAYSFKAMFEPQIALGVKLQTVRANRKRNPRVGDRLQLYVAMRTKQCRKIRPDVTCTSVNAIEIVTSAMIDEVIVSIAINGTLLNRLEIERFARMDGFRVRTIERGITFSARSAMGSFWLDNHGDGRFEGVLIRWSLS